MTTDPTYWIDTLQLEPHPEGGYYKEIYQSPQTHETADGRVRPLATSIYFLLTKENPSRFHRLTADELWYFHQGDALTVHMIYPDGRYGTIRLGPDAAKGEVLQAVVPTQTIFGSCVENGQFALVSCMVSPGFDYADFELFTQKQLLALNSELAPLIKRLAYDKLPER